MQKRRRTKRRVKICKYFFNMEGLGNCLRLCREQLPKKRPRESDEHWDTDGFGLIDLPAELLQQILLSADLEDFLHLGMTCKLFASWTSSEHSWYKLLCRDMPEEAAFTNGILPPFVKEAPEPGWKRYYLRVRRHYRRYGRKPFAECYRKAREMRLVQRRVDFCQCLCVHFFNQQIGSMLFCSLWMLRDPSLAEAVFPKAPLLARLLGFSIVLPLADVFEFMALTKTLFTMDTQGEEPKYFSFFKRLFDPKTCSVFVFDERQAALSYYLGKRCDENAWVKQFNHCPRMNGDNGPLWV